MNTCRAGAERRNNFFLSVKSPTTNGKCNLDTLVLSEKLFSQMFSDLGNGVCLL